MRRISEFTFEENKRVVNQLNLFTARNFSANIENKKQNYSARVSCASIKNVSRLS